MHAADSQLTFEQTTRLLDRTVLKLAYKYARFDRLRDLEHDLAIEIGRLPGVTDERLLGITRSLLGRALHALAIDTEQGAITTQDEEDRYLNAICREALPPDERDRLLGGEATSTRGG